VGEWAGCGAARARSWVGNAAEAAGRAARGRNERRDDAGAG
jgi:hypothetical protein